MGFDPGVEAIIISECVYTPADVRAMFSASHPEWLSGAVSEAMSNLQGGIMYPTFSELRDQEKAYKMKAAVDRDNRFNLEEQRVYNDTVIELEFGFGFFLRAHP